MASDYRAMGPPYGIVRIEQPRLLWHNHRSAPPQEVTDASESSSFIRKIFRMLLQTNSYIVPKDKRAEHARLVRRFRQTLLRLGCDHFEVYEQVGSNWSNSESTGRYVQILRFVDRKHQLSVQAAERSDPTAQAVIAEFCDLINFPYQQQQGLFAVGFYTSVLPVAPKRGTRAELISTVDHEVQPDEAGQTAEEAAADEGEIEDGQESTEARAEMSQSENFVDADQTDEESADAFIDSEVVEEPEVHPTDDVEHDQAKGR
jgi:hypothetical protein